MSTAQVIASVGLVTGVLASFISGLVLVDFSKTPPLSIQPFGVAFSGIWTVVYVTLVLTALVPPTIAPLPAWLTTAALVLTCIWAALARFNLWRPAAFVLLAAAVVAWVACATHALDVRVPRTWLAHSAIGLFAGWLSVATALGLALAYPAADRPTTLFAGACVVAVASVVLGRPIPNLSIVWALALQQEPSAWTNAGILVAVGGALGAISNASQQS